MKKILQIILFLFFTALYSQNYNVKDFGLKGDGKSNDSKNLELLIEVIKKNRNLINSKFPSNATIYFPTGDYLFETTVQIPEYINIVGSEDYSSVIIVKNNNSGGFYFKNDVEDQKNQSNVYTTIKNLVIIGPEYGNNPFAWKDISKNENNENFGIKINSLRNRIENCTITGFWGAGIILENTYYNFIEKCYILNNRIGILLSKTSTSAFIQSNELRFNAIGISITENSFGSFITNNMIESNISNFLPDFTSEKDPSILKKGIGIAIINSNWNTISNNYFEQHFVNIGLLNANKNNINSNFIAIGDLLPYKNSENQLFLKFFSDSKDNIIQGNILEGNSDKIDYLQIAFADGTKDLSSNMISFNIKDNANLELKWGKIKNNIKLPIINK